MAGLATGLILTLAIHAVGPVGAIAPALAVAGLLLLRYPAAALGLLLVSVVLVDTTDVGLLPAEPRFYEPLGGGVTILDVLLIVGLLGVLIRTGRELSRPVWPTPFAVPLTILGLALICGMVDAHWARPEVGTKELLHRATYVLYIIVVPILTVNVLRSTKSLRAFAVAAAGLAAWKGISGTYAALAGVGAVVEGQTVSYLEPLSNLVMLAFILGVAIALVRKQKLPLWMLATVPFDVLALALSYRRSFWIGAVLALLVVLVMASRRRGRAVLAIGAVAVALALVATLSFGGAGSGTSSPLVARASSLSPGGIDSNRGDRYRNDERRNVIANLHEHPLTGLGLGVPWRIHYPTAEALDRRYTHLAILAYWLQFGPLGVIAYIALFGSFLWVSFDVFRRHLDPVVKIVSLAIFGAILGLIVVELTATFTGVDPRVSIILGATLGWLSVAWKQLPERDQKVGPPPVLARTASLRVPS
ncbi:MAG TPA: O-antigen ligase family protein [Solirubrobacterales bacterium]|nr:O-antigen ligase family protein [Solirubrobacterales bacterium]